MMSTQAQIVMASLPAQQLRADHFRAVQVPVPQLGAGQVLARLLYLSLDPYLRKAMNNGIEGKGHAAIRPGDPMKSRAVGRVTASRHPGFEAGDLVLGLAPWADCAVLDGSDLTRLDPGPHASSAFLGGLGQSGLTAWVGMTRICQPQAGATVVVSSAAGAVGSIAGQIARIAGCRVVGIAGGDEKCRHVIEQLGFNDCVDYKQPDFEDRLAAATPDGVDACFEGVGGRVFDATLARLNRHARVALCGMIGQYDNPQPYAFRHFSNLMSQAVTLQAYYVGDYESLRVQAIQQLGSWLAGGQLVLHETVAEGLLNAPAAMVAMLQGRGLGKHLVRLN
jgi:NADPH-dependent curcumin reductase CurA